MTGVPIRLEAKPKEMKVLSARAGASGGGKRFRRKCSAKSAHRPETYGTNEDARHAGDDAAGQSKAGEDVEIALIRVDGTAGGGMVSIRMDGHKNVLGVKIDPEVAGDVEMLRDWCAAASNDAAKKVIRGVAEGGQHVGRTRSTRRACLADAGFCGTAGTADPRVQTAAGASDEVAQRAFHIMRRSRGTQISWHEDRFSTSKTS